MLKARLCFNFLKVHHSLSSHCFKPLVSNECQPAPPYIVAAGAAELVGTLVLCPLEQTRIKMVSDPNYADDFFAAVARLFADEKVEGVLGGCGAS